MPKRPHHLGKVGVADGSFESVFNLFAAEEALAREDEWIDQLEQSPRCIGSPCQPVHGDAIVPGSPDAPIRNHAASGDNIHFDAVLLPAKASSAAKRLKTDSNEPSATPTFPRWCGRFAIVATHLAS